MPSFAFKCVYFRNRKQTSSIALHCFGASFSRRSNEPRHSTVYTVWLVLHFWSWTLVILLWDGIPSLIVTQFHFEANSGFGEPTANGDSCICRVWWLGWCTEEEEDHGSGISLMQFWAPNLIDWAPHTSASSRAMIIRVLCKNVELINPMLQQRLHICCFVSCQ